MTTRVRRYAAMPLPVLLGTAFSCAITSPTAGASLTQGTPVTITGTLTGAAVAVQVKLGPTVLGSASIVGLTWSYSWTPQSGDVGAQTINATATAANGAQAVASGVTVTVASGFVNFATILSTGAQVCQTDLGLTYGATPKPGASNTSTSVVSSSGNPSGAYVPVRAKATNSAAIGSGATFNIYVDGGTTPIMTGVTPAVGVPVAFTGAAVGVSWTWAAGSSVANDVWDQTASAWADQSGNGKHYSQAVVTKQPVIGVGPNGFVELLFDGVDDFFASSLVFGAPASTPVSLFLVFRQITSVNNAAIVGSDDTFGVLGLRQTGGTAINLFNNAAGPSSSNLPLSTYGVITAYASGSTSDSIEAGAGDTVHTGSSSGNNSGTTKQIGGGSAVVCAKIGVLAIGYQAGVLPGTLRAASISKYGAIAA